VPALAQGRAHRRGAAILPDDGAVDGFARFAIPYQRGFALVGDADAGDVGRPGARHRHRLAQHRQGVLEQILGLVLHPAAIGEMLRQVAPCGGHRRQGGRAEGDAARGGGALVEGEDQVLGHLGCL